MTSKSTTASSWKSRSTSSFSGEAEVWMVENSSVVESLFGKIGKNLRFEH